MSDEIGPHISTGCCKKDVTPVRWQWSYVFLALTHRYNLSDKLCLISDACEVADVKSMTKFRAASLDTDCHKSTLNIFKSILRNENFCTLNSNFTLFCSQGPSWHEVINGSGNGLVFGTKPLPEPMMTTVYAMASLGRNGLNGCYHLWSSVLGILYHLQNSSEQDFC